MKFKVWFMKVFYRLRFLEYVIVWKLKIKKMYLNYGGFCKFSFRFFSVNDDDFLVLV